MKSTLYATRDYFLRNGSRIVAFAMSVAIVAILSFAFTNIASAQTYTSSSSTTSSSSSFVQMGIGARGANVTALQTFLAADSAIYPEGLVTGYFGSLTRAAVQRFQARYGISTTGYVGPLTLHELNEVLAQGGLSSSGGSTGSTGGSTGSTSGMGSQAPYIFNVSVASGTNMLSFSFNTDQSTSARIVYGTSPLMFNEGDINGVGFSPLSGSVASDTNVGTSHSISVPNLSSNTSYYMTIIVTNASGQVSVWGPNNTVRTNP